MRGGALEVALIMRLGVFGRRRPQPDPTLADVIDAARARGHDTVVLDIADFVSGPVAFTPGTGLLTLGEVTVALADLDVLLLGPLPSAFARTAPSGTQATSDAHDARQKQQAARHQLAWSIACDVEARGIPVLSSPTRARPFDAKPMQLAALARAGVTVPSTVVTDGDDGLGALNDSGRDDGVDLLCKPVMGGPITLGIAGLRPGVPTIVQPRLRGRQLRLAVVGGEVVAVGAIDFAAAATDKGVIDVRASSQPWSKLLPSPSLTALGRLCAETCHFDVCAVDAIEGTDGTVTVLDVNRTPWLVDLAAACDTDIAGAIVDLCEQRAHRRP